MTFTQYYMAMYARQAGVYLCDTEGHIAYLTNDNSNAGFEIKNCESGLSVRCMLN